MNQGDDFETLSEDLTYGGKKGDVSYGTPHHHSGISRAVWTDLRGQ